MDSEDIGLDFESDRSSEKPKEEVWHSESEDSTRQNGGEATDDPSDHGNDEEKQDVNTTVQKLDKLLVVNPSSSSEDSLIWPRPKKRRRLSVSRSVSAKQDSNKAKKPKKRQ